MDDIAVQGSALDRALTRLAAEREVVAQPPGASPEASGGPLPAPIAAPVESTARPQPAAGWYVDPYDEAQRRWWDGSAWTDQVRAAASLVPAPAASAEPMRWQQDTRSSIKDLAQHINGVPAARGRHARLDPSALPGPRRSDLTGSAASGAQVPWFEMAERNPAATAGLVLAIVGMVVNPAAVVSVTAILLSGVGLAKSRTTYLSAGRGRAVWGIALGSIGGLFWGAATWFVFQHPELLETVGIRI